MMQYANKLCGLLLVTTLSFINAHAVDTQVGNVTNVTLTANGNLTSVNFWISNGGVAQVTPFAADTVRVQYYFTPLWAKEEPMIAKQTNLWASVAGATFTDQGTTYKISTAELNVIVTKAPFKVEFKDKTDFTLSQDVAMYFNSSYTNFTVFGQSGWTSGDYKLKAVKSFPTGQAAYGLGEYGGALNRRGIEMECWNTGKYNWDEMFKPQYMNIPFFYATQPANGSAPAFAYGIFFNNPCRPLFSFSSTKSGANNLSFEAGDGQMDYFFFGGGANHTMAGVADRYSELTGRPAMLPKWAFGYHQSRFSYSNQDWVQYIASAGVTNDFPLDAVYMDIDYMDANHDNNIGDGQLRQLSLNTDFPNPAGMASFCANNGVKIVPLIEPWLEPGDTTLYNDANSNSHFIKDNSSATVVRSIYVGNVSWFDFSSTPMRQWWAGKIGNWLNSFPFSGIWNDLTEPEGGDQIPMNGLLWCDGRYGLATSDTRRQWSNERNYFGLRCSQTSYETLLTKFPNKRPFVLSRSGNAGLQRYAVSWSGDTGSGWNNVKWCIPDGLSAMISGAGYYGHDMGGFIGDPGAELQTRAVEWGAFLPFCRMHADKGAPNREPWRYAEPYKSDMRGSLKFRYRLMPYLYSLAYHGTQTGEPMNTPTAFQFYGDVNTASQNNYDFMVGDYILVPPVYTAGATTRAVYLPFGTNAAWYYFPTGTRYCGGQTVTVNTPLGGTNIFMRSGAIIPQGPAMQYMGATNVNFLDVQCWPEGNSSFTLYEDAGDGWDFTNSTGRALRTMTSSRTSTNWDFTIGARQGGFTNPVARSFYVYANNPSPTVNSIAVNGSTIPHVGSINDQPQGWLVTAAGKLQVRVPDDGAQKAIHVDWTGLEFTTCGSPDDLGIPGGWNGWTNDFTSPWLLGKIAPPGTPAGANWYTNSILVGTDIAAGTYQFKLRAGHTWTRNWGFNGAAALNVVTNTTTTLNWSGTTNASITLVSGYYSFRVLEPTQNADTTIAVLRSSTKPVGVTFNGITPVFPTSNDAAVVSITLSAAKSAEEHIYVRWTTNNWATSFFVEATGSGTSYTATMPAFATGTTVNYYVLSSTSTSLNSANADALTLSLDANNGINYTYTPAPIPWPGVGYAYDVIDHYKEEAVVGNGFMTVMLDLNGALYDIYFPTVGVPAGTATANEGYRGPGEWPPGCQNSLQANGQMNLIGAVGGIAVVNGTQNNVYWLKNANATDYTEVGQRWVSDNVNVVVTSNRLNIAGSNIKVQQYDFVPSEDTIPVSGTAGARSDGTRTNRAAHVKRFLLTNNEASTKNINFYWDANFNVKGDNAYDVLTNYNNTMVVYDRAGRVVSGSWCNPNGEGGSTDTEYDPAGTGGWSKSNSVYFATAMKLVTNAVTGAGVPADGSSRDHTAIDNQEGWIGKKITIDAGQTVEVDVLTVGSWDTFANASGTHDFWGVPTINWFYANNMSNAQATTEAYWSNWLGGGVTVDFPDDAYDRLFKRSLLVSKLHCDPVGGAVIAGMHNGAYPFVWPRDGVYAAITLDRTGHSSESTAFYRWLTNAQRPSEVWGAGFFYQKYTTDGKPVWTNPQVDETASVPWGMYYHYLATGDGAFLSNNWSLAYTSARASSEDSTFNFANLNFDDTTHLMWTWNVWEDVLNEHLYSNASVVRGLQDAANIADVVGSNSWATTFRTRATDIKGDATKGIVKRINDNVEPSDISHLGMVFPYEIFTPTDPLMTNILERLNGRQTSSPSNYLDNIVETAPDVAGLLRRYNHKIGGETDIYWNGGPWFLASSWWGEYMMRWQDYLGGKSLIDTNKVILDKLISKLGPMGFAGEQIAVNTGEQKYPGFWLQTAWPNVWESHSTLIDQMMLFLDYTPQTNNTCAFAPKLPTGWSTMTFNNLPYKNQRLNVTVSESTNQCDHFTRMDINKLTAGALDADVYLRIPPFNAYGVPTMIITNGGYYAAPVGLPDWDPNTGRIHIRMHLTSAAGNNTIAVTYGTNPNGICPGSDYDHDGASDATEMNNGSPLSNPLNPDTDNDGMLDGFEINNGLNPNVDDSAGDKDGDGQNNFAEFQTGTAANDANSSLHIMDVARQPNGDVVVTAASVAGKKYVLLAATSPAGTFVPVSTTNTAGSATLSFTDPAPSESSKLYKVQYIP